MQIAEGMALLERALRIRRAGPYQLQAAIAAIHAGAPTAAATDWSQIALLYQELGRLTPSPVIDLNHAAAIAMAVSPEVALPLIDRLASEGHLENYLPLHATRADLHRRLGHHAEAAHSYSRALALKCTDAERQFLEQRLAEVTTA
jgi:RNA polymerase sigma-70 factor (ECF subfamily)